VAVDAAQKAEKAAKVKVAERAVEAAKKVEEEVVVEVVVNY